MGLEVRRTVKPKSVQFGLGWHWHPLSFQISGTKRVSQKLLCRSLVSVARLSESASCLPPFLGSYSASSRREQPLGGSQWCFRRPRESLSGPPRGGRSGAQAGVWRAERQWPSWQPSEEERTRARRWKLLGCGITWSLAARLELADGGDKLWSLTEFIPMSCHSRNPLPPSHAGPRTLAKLVHQCSCPCPPALGSLSKSGSQNMHQLPRAGHGWVTWREPEAGTLLRVRGGVRRCVHRTLTPQERALPVFLLREEGREEPGPGGQLSSPVTPCHPGISSTDVPGARCSLGSAGTSQAS